MLEKGQLAPTFSLPDQEGIIHNLEDYTGQIVLLYFYPKDDTPGCTKEACTIAEVFEEFEKSAVKIFGISADSSESHKVFVKKYNLPFTLLSDSEFKAIKSYGAFKQGSDNEQAIQIKRISYLVDEKGKIAKVYPDVDPASHAAEILKDLGE